MFRILIYAPELAGHPQIYCRVIADALRDEDCHLDLALGIGEKGRIADVPDLHPLIDRRGVDLLPTRESSATASNFLRAEELAALQDRLRTDCTLFIEADKSEAEFRRIAAGEAPRLRGRNVGIFANTAEWYPGEDSFTGVPRRIRAKTLRTTLGNIKRALLDQRKTARYFYEELILGRHVLDAVIVKDERLASWFGPPALWMPEISRPAATPEAAEDQRLYEALSSAYREFLHRNQGREPVLYFGDAAFYKGYDLFLEYLRREPAVCGVHAGRTYDSVQRSYFQVDVEAVRRLLMQEGRLFETNCYIHSHRLKQLFFGSIERYVTTHRLTLSSSTALQALELGKPLLVAGQGLLGHRVRTNALGRTYRYGDVDDLIVQGREFRREDPARYAPAIRSFIRHFSDAEIVRFFRGALLQSTPSRSLGTAHVPLR